MLIEGFHLSPEIEKVIVDELEHQRSFNTLELPPDVSPDKVVAAYLGFKLAQQLYYHEKGLSSPWYMSETTERFTTQYNTSHFREVKMSDLLEALGLALCKQNFLQCRRDLSVLKEKLGRIVSVAIVPIDVSPFIKFISALMEAGLTQELFLNSSYQPGHLSDQVHKQLLRPLLSGIHNNLLPKTQSVHPPVVLIEQKSANQDLSYAVKFLVSNSRSHYLHWKAHKRLTKRQLLELTPSSSQQFKVILTPDAEGTLNLARQSTKVLSNDWVSKEETPELIIPDVAYLPNQTWSRETPNLFPLISQSIEIEPYLKLVHKLPKSGSQMSGARYKLLEIVKRYDLIEGSESFIVCLADGGGSYSSLLMHLCPSSHLLFNTLVHLDKLKPEQMGVTTPTSTFCKHIHPSRITDLTVTSAHGGDLIDVQTWQEIISTVRNKTSHINILTFDMESIEEHYIDVLELLKKFIRATTPDVIIIKLFCSIEESYLGSFSSMISTMYHWVHFEKPSFSNYLSEEVFLIAKRRSPHPILATNLPIQHMVSSIKGRSSSEDAHMISHILIKQLSWRKNLVMCCSIEGPVEEVEEDQSDRVTRSMRYIHRQLTSLVQICKSDSYEMDISTQHMLIGDTYGKELVW